MVKKKDAAATTTSDERKRGWKSNLIRSLKEQNPQLSHAALAAEFLKKSGESVSIPTIVQALKDSRTGKGGRETINDLLRVKEWCADKNIKPEALAQQIELVTEMSARVGGLGALTRILSALQAVRD